MQSLEVSSSATDDSSGAASSSASFDTPFASPGSDSQIPSVNPSPNVSSLSSRVDGYSSPKVPTGSPLTSTPTTSSASLSQSQPLTPVSFHGQQASTPLSRPHVQNPLVRAGLVPESLADILSHQAYNATEKRSRRITGVRIFMSNEYTEIMRVKDRREKEVAEMKQTQKEEREHKRLKKEQERERKRKEREEKKKQRKRKEREEKKKQSKSHQEKGKGKKCRRSSSEEEPHNESDDDSHHHQTLSRTRTIRAPIRYEDGSDVESDESNTVCIICNAREPPIAVNMVFWVDCDKCGEWAHTHTVRWVATRLLVSLFVQRVLFELSACMAWISQW